MNIETVTEIIQMILAPTVMILTCTLIQSGVLGRYSNVGAHIRSRFAIGLNFYLQMICLLNGVERG